MRAVVQRCDFSSVYVGDEKVGSSDKGLLVLLGVCNGDTQKEAELLARKISSLRIFCDENEKMNLSVKDISGSVLAVSNFTLYADIKKGNRPSFTNAMEPVMAEELYDCFCENLKNLQVPTEKGMFGADMRIDMICNGPVTIIMDTDIWKK